MTRKGHCASEYKAHAPKVPDCPVHVASWLLLPHLDRLHRRLTHKRMHEEVGKVLHTGHADTCKPSNAVSILLFASLHSWSESAPQEHAG